MILVSDLLEGGQACQVGLRLPKGKIVLSHVDVHFGDGLVDVECSSHAALNCTLDDGTRQPSYELTTLRTLPNGAHQPPAGCAWLRSSRVATTSPHHHWPDMTTGKSTPPRDVTQAQDPSERGAVDGRLHARVGRRDRRAG